MIRNMNPYILFSIGLLLILAGSFVCYLGQRKHSALDVKSSEDALNAKVTSVLDAIHDARLNVNETTGNPTSASNEVTRKRIDAIEQDFREWADSFVVSRSSKKLGFDKKKIELLDAELSISRKWRPLFQQWIDTILKIAEAYNLTSKTDFIDTQAISLQENLYAKMDPHPTIKFGGKATWLFDVVTRKPVVIDDTPVFVIAFSHEGKYTGEVAFTPKQDDISVNLRLIEMPTPREIKKNYNLTDNSGITEAFKALVETQILAIYEK